MEYLEGLKNMLKELDVLKKSVTTQIDSLPEGDIRIAKQVKQGKKYTIFKQYTNGGKYICITKDKKLVKNLSIKTFYLQYLYLVDELSDLIRLASQTAEKIDIDKILNELPEEIRGYILFDSGEGTIKTRDEVQKKKTDELMNEQYEPNDKYADSHKHRTSDGTYVKSKSELIIYEMLLKYGIRFQYEKPVVINGITYHPDFTIYLPDGQIIYWEHAGLMTKEDYRNRHKYRMAAFESAGIVPWDNLIVTYDDKYGNIDINIIESEIRNKLLR